MGLYTGNCLRVSPRHNLFEYKSFEFHGLMRRIRREFVFLSLMLLCPRIQAFFASIDNSHPLVVCDSLNDDIQSLFALTEASLIFPNALSESQCVAINTCSEQNHRGEAVPANTWLHRGLHALQFDSELVHDPDPNAYNHYSIQYARVPAGIQIAGCQPDFDHLRLHGHYICNPNPNAMVLRSGQCPFHFPSREVPQWPSEPTELLQCLSPLQYNAQIAVNQNAGLWNQIAYPVASEPGSTQMIRYSFVEGYGCYDASHLTPGTYLSSSMPPNKIMTCPSLSVGSYINDFSSECLFSCPSDYNIDPTNHQCVHKCGNVSSPTCEDGFFASGICSDVSPNLYTCSPCNTVAGKHIMPWDAQNPATCVYDECPPGTYESESVCNQCAVNTYSETSGQQACASCAYGKYTEAGGSSSCIECFTKDISGATCDAGEQLSADISFIESFFNTSALTHQAHFDLERFCADGYACLPCSPGTFEQNSACTPCEVGTYQPNFKSTSCFACGGTLTTLQEGSKQPEECVCREGFE